MSWLRWRAGISSSTGRHETEKGAKKCPEWYPRAEEEVFRVLVPMRVSR